MSTRKRSRKINEFVEASTHHSHTKISRTNIMTHTNADTDDAGWLVDLLSFSLPIDSYSVAFKIPLIIFTLEFVFKANTRRHQMLK